MALAEVVVCAVGRVVTLPAVEITAQATALLVLVMIICRQRPGLGSPFVCPRITYAANKKLAVATEIHTYMFFVVCWSLLFVELDFKQLWLPFFWMIILPCIK